MTPKEVKAKKQRGQIVVEYLLLLVFVVFFLAGTVRLLVSRKEGPDGGVIIRLWNEMVQAIVTDKADDL
ncbi:MAG: hypothetical protein ABL958_01980 [Bdellovibrionia bacterium]